MASRHYNRGISAPIVAGFIVVLTLMASLTVVGLRYMSETNARLVAIVEGNNVKTQLATTMQSAINGRLVSMHAVSLLQDPFEQDEEVQRMAAYGSAYIDARLRFEALPLSEQEQLILRRVNDIAPRAREAVMGVVEMALAGDEADIFRRMREEAVPLQRAMSEELGKLLRLQQEQANAAEAAAAAAFSNARRLMLLLMAATLLAGLAIGGFVSRRVSRQAQQLAHYAMYDPLTGLYNRSLLQERLERAVARARESGDSFGVALMDLDRFKHVNDTLGHEVGDELLREVGLRLSGAVRPEDVVARLGGDEFVVLYNRLRERHVDYVAGKLLASLDRPFMWEGQSIDLDASIGVALYPDHGTTPSALLRHADIAMYAAKRSGRHFVVYAPEQKRTDPGDLSLKSELREAIQHDQLTLHFQPKIDHGTGMVVELEALVRWLHPERGFLPPNKFVGLAEEAGLIGELTEWVLRTALREVAALEDEGHPLAVAVNLSARNLLDRHLAKQVQGLLETSGVDASRLILEITESAVMDNPAEALVILSELDRMGVTLSIDDFGTGYSSLAYLKRLPVDEIKIDQSFVKEMIENENDAVIVRSIIDLAHNLGLRVTAEGVETREVWDALTTLGCDRSQGYYMARPLPAQELRNWLRESPWRSRRTRRVVPEQPVGRA